MQPSQDEKHEDEKHVTEIRLDPESSSIDTDNTDLGDASGFVGHGEAIPLDEKANKRLLWKIDLYILPILCLVYMLQFLDKSTISFASVMGIITDAKLIGNDFNWLGSVFNIGFLLAEYPVNLALHRLPIAKFLASQIILWGAISMAMGFCKNFKGLLILRAMLGVFEASITPGFVLIVSQWWKKDEQALRTGIWCANQGLSQVIGALMSYGIAIRVKQAGYHGKEGWQLLFLVTGVMTVATGILFLFMMPDSPKSAWFLSREEKVMVFERLRTNQQGTGNKKLKRYQVVEALKDPMTWLYFLATLSICLPAGAFLNFKNVIIKGFGVSDDLALLYNAPNGAFQFISVLILCRLADHTANRCFWAMIALVPPIICLALMVMLPRRNVTGQLIAFTFAGSFSAGFTLLLSLITSNVAGWTKKTTVNFVVMIAYCVGMLIGPFIAHLQDAPRYVTAKIATCALFTVTMVLFFAIRTLAAYRNKAKDKKLADMGRFYERRPNQEFMDLTDMENLEFRYVL